MTTPAASPAKVSPGALIADILERMLRAFIVTFVGAFPTTTIGMSVSTQSAAASSAAAAGLAAATSLLLSLIGSRSGASSASLLPASLDPATQGRLTLIDVAAVPEVAQLRTDLSALVQDAGTHLANTEDAMRAVYDRLGGDVHNLSDQALNDVAGVVDQIVKDALILRPPVMAQTDHSNKKLGRVPSVPDERDVQAGDYRVAGKAVPAAVDFYSEVGEWPLYDNDKIGDCTVAAAAHMVEAWTADATGTAKIIPPASVIRTYSTVGGYKPGDASTDQGAQPRDVLSYWRKTGINRHKVAGFAAVNPADQDEVRWALAEFGGLYLGVDMPLTAQSQAVWDLVGSGQTGPAQAGSWGGHAVDAVGYDADGLIIVSWGELFHMTWAFFEAYVDEAWAVVSTDWLDAAGHTPDGLDLAALMADVATVTGAASS